MIAPRAEQRIDHQRVEDRREPEHVRAFEASTEAQPPSEHRACEQDGFADEHRTEDPRGRRDAHEVDPVVRDRHPQPEHDEHDARERAPATRATERTDDRTEREHDQHDLGRPSRLVVGAEHLDERLAREGNHVRRIVGASVACGRTCASWLRARSPPHAWIAAHEAGALDGDDPQSLQQPRRRGATVSVCRADPHANAVDVDTGISRGAG